ncbi:energy transducer TonB [Sphingomonas solaris]|nr:energy transducer TonB [Sphingomonas solaris]
MPDPSPLPVPRSDEAMWVTTADYPAAALKAKEEGTVTVELHLDATGRVERCTTLESSGSLLLDGTTCRLMIERASYYPTKDKAGRPVAAQVTKRVRWQTPAGALRGTPPLALRAFRFSPAAGGSAGTPGQGTASARPTATYGPAAPAPRDRPGLLGWLKQSDYPAESLEAREQGELTASFEVSETGRVENCRIIRSSGYLRLDDATCPLIEERARFRPATDAAGKAMRSADVRTWRWILPPRGLIGPDGIVTTPN